MADAVADTTITPEAAADLPPVVIDAKSTPVVDDAAIAAAAAKAKETPGDEAITPVQYEQTGDPGLDLALDFVGRLGISEAHPAMAAAVNGNFDLIKAHLATLGDKAKGWEMHVALAEKSYKDAQTAEATTKAAITGAVHEAVGGQEQWATIQKWAVATAEPHEREQINAMLTAGPIQARAAAIMLQGLYDKASGVVRNPADPTKGASSKGAPSPTTPLTRREAVALTNELARKHGTYQLEQRPEYRAVWARVPSAR